MPYALIPEGFTLKKVTKAQEKAVSDLRRSTYILETIKNPTTVPILAGGVVAIISGLLLDKFIEELPPIPSVDLNKIKKTVLATTPLTLPMTILSKVGPEAQQEMLSDISEEGFFGAYKTFLERESNK